MVRNFISRDTNVVLKIYKTLIRPYIEYFGGSRGIMVIVIGNGHGDTSSNPGRDSLHFT